MAVQDKTRVGIAAVKTAMGWLGIAWSERGLVKVTLPQPTEAAALGGLPGGDPAPLAPPNLDVIALADRLASTRCGPSLSLVSKSARPSWSAVSAMIVFLLAKLERQHQIHDSYFPLD